MERASQTQYELQLARRMSRLGTETAFEVLNRARALERQGKSIIHLEIGEPDFDTPANVVEAAVDALHKGWTHYGPAAGQPELRQALAEYVGRTRGVKVSSDEVVVVPGGKPIIFFTLLALADVGDEVIYPNLGFPIYESMINYAGAKAVPIRLYEDRDFGLDAKELKSLITDRTRLIIINSPENPTGGVLSKQQAQAPMRLRNAEYLRRGEIPDDIVQSQKDFLKSLDTDKKITPDYRKYRYELIADGEERLGHIAENNVKELTALVDYYWKLAAKYEKAQKKPWLPVAPDPPKP